ncbi:mRNA-capping enzyme subunit beta [Microbotryomycetes sp. JL221]|nr:mRNA-capping enzyme subunit beta [Microbotryomycetes sp. JL221]
MTDPQARPSDGVSTSASSLRSLLNPSPTRPIDTRTGVTQQDGHDDDDDDHHHHQVNANIHDDQDYFTQQHDDEDDDNDEGQIKRSMTRSHNINNSNNKRQRSRSPTPTPHNSSQDDRDMLPPKITRRDSPPAPAPAPAPQQTTSTANHHVNISSLEPSIFNVEPIDEFTREVADWLWSFAKTLPWKDSTRPVEVEAKLGILVQKTNSKDKIPTRISFPVAIETSKSSVCIMFFHQFTLLMLFGEIPIVAVITDDSWLKFESNMSRRQFNHFNHILNEVTTETNQPQYNYSKMKHERRREIDSFHLDDSNQPKHPSGTNKVRVTKDKTGQHVLNVLRKVRIADMSVYSPKRIFDWRLSISVEEQQSSLPTTPKIMERIKDRISYTHEITNVDLTTVSSTHSKSQQPLPPPPQSMESTFELELEFKNTFELLNEAEKESKGQENNYLQMIQVFLNSIR